MRYTPDWVTSDLHLGHANILKYCERPGDGSVESMNEALVEKWNAVVRPRDRVWVLGDIVMGKRDETIGYVNRLHGKISLIPGNHDDIHPMYAGTKTGADHRVAVYRDNLDEILPVEVLAFGMVWSHFPYVGAYTDHAEEDRSARYDPWSPQDRGKVLVHGHVHDEWQTRLSPAGSLMINVGADAWDHTPLSFEQVAELAAQA